MGKETLKETLSKTAAMAPFAQEAPVRGPCSKREGVLGARDRRERGHVRDRR